jgi:polyisoprenoid-binding protein YceI
VALAGAALLWGAAAAPARAQDTYAVDAVHSSVIFKVEHAGIAYVFGRFNDVSGSFTINKADAGKSSFTLEIPVDSIDTNNKKRDGHLLSPDFFDVKQYPKITFSSTEVKAIEGGYAVTGQFTMHGTTKTISLVLRGGKTVEFPKGVQRTGYTTELTLRRTDYGMDRLTTGLGTDIGIVVSLEGVKK